MVYLYYLTSILTWDCVWISSVCGVWSYLSVPRKTLVLLKIQFISTLFWGCGGFLTLHNLIQHHCAVHTCSFRGIQCSRGFQMVWGPGMGRTHPIEPVKSLCALFWTPLFVPLTSVSVSESPSPLNLLWPGFQLWMLPLTTSVIPRQPTYPCLPPLMCDLMYCLTVFHPFKINCSFITPEDKKPAENLIV